MDILKLVVVVLKNKRIIRGNDKMTGKKKKKLKMKVAEMMRKMKRI